jgi:purine nucleosidase
MENQENWLIDTDSGVDGAAALLIALADKRINIVGITTVFGHSTIENVVTNVTKILEVADKRIPIYIGASRPLIDDRPERDDYYGNDGLGDCAEEIKLAGYRDCIQQETAAFALLRLSKEYETKGKLNIFASGPLTNLALAAKVDKNLSSKINRVVIMGGAWLNMGTTSLSAEFNFFMDPDSASVTLRHYENVTLVPIETCTRVFIDEKETAELRSVETKAGKFFKAISTVVLKDLDGTPKPLADSLPDVAAISCAFNSDVIKTIEEYETYVDIKGAKTRGSLVTIWYKYGTYYDDVLKKPEKLKKVKIVTETHKEKVIEKLKHALAAHK